MKSRTQPNPRTQPTLLALTEDLRRRSLKVTGPRKAILELLRGREHPLTHREIFAALPEGQCDLATVYRSMRLLEELGAVKRFDFGDRSARFELLREGPDGHHHHLVCKRCARVVEIGECFPKELERRIAARNRFSQVTHTLEFFGICSKCQ